ncbi:MAG: hypothetical protein GY866_26615 [Proteobacteria bacterium]|nr:hypothetical protein [Pseudomonadota bacterium]
MNRNVSDQTRSRTFFWRLFQIATAILCLAPSKSFALEVYTLITNGCHPETGLIVGTDEDNAYLLNLDGKLAVVKRQEIDLVLVYYIHDNPIKSLDLTSGLQDLLREVQVDDNENTHFIGWPIRFMENLIIFFDIDGKTHLVDVDKIKRFSQPGNIDFTVKETTNYKAANFGLGGNLPECQSGESETGKYANPTRMISDRIKVDKFFSVYNTGFALLKRFQRKTVFYAKPYLFEKATRLGIVYMDDARQELNFIIPFYFQWSSGSPYASQGVYSIGSKPLDLLPLVEPTLAFRSDVKSHFFTGSFLGNALCLSAGSECIIKNRMAFTNFFSKIDDDTHAVYPQFNYLALTGADFHEYSFSGGFYYPIYGILGNRIFREIPSRGSSPIVRFQRITQDSILKLIYSKTQTASNAPTDKEIKLIKASELEEFATMSDASKLLIESLESFDLQTRYLRFDFSYDVNDELNIGFSEIFFQGNYVEKFAGEDYALDFSHVISSLSVKQDFSDYITLKGNINYFIRNYRYELENETSDSNERKVSYAISIEFLL